MRAVIQRVAKANLKVNGKAKAEIGPGLVVTIGVARNDNLRDVEHIAARVVNMRIFNDESGRMSQSLKDIGGEVILLCHVSLLGDCSKGRRPSFTYAGSSRKRARLLAELAKQIEEAEVTVQTASEEDPVTLEIECDGPITLLADSKRSIIFRRKRRRHTSSGLQRPYTRRRRPYYNRYQGDRRR